jgi:hypothetical protein
MMFFSCMFQLLLGFHHRIPQIRLPRTVIEKKKETKSETVIVDGISESSLDRVSLVS